MALVVKNPLSTAGDVRDSDLIRSLTFSSWVQKFPWRRAWQSTPVFLGGEFHGQRSLAGHGPQGHRELDRTEVAEHTHMTYRMLCNKLWAIGKQ